MIDLTNCRKRPKAKTEYIGARTDLDTAEWLKKYCFEHKVSQSGVISELIKSLRLTEEAKDPVSLTA